MRLFLLLIAPFALTILAAGFVQTIGQSPSPLNPDAAVMPNRKSGNTCVLQQSSPELPLKTIGRRAAVVIVGVIHGPWYQDSAIDAAPAEGGTVRAFNIWLQSDRDTFRYTSGFVWTVSDNVVKNTTRYSWRNAHSSTFF